MDTDWSMNHAALMVPCAMCGAPVGEVCLGQMHLARLRPMLLVFKAGFAAGIKEGRRRERKGTGEGVKG